MWDSGFLEPRTQGFGSLGLRVLGSIGVNKSLPLGHG